MDSTDTLTDIERARFELIKTVLGNPVAFEAIADRARAENIPPVRRLIAMSGEIIDGIRSAAVPGK